MFTFNYGSFVESTADTKLFLTICSQVRITRFPCLIKLYIRTIGAEHTENYTFKLICNRSMHIKKVFSARRSWRQLCHKDYVSPAHGKISSGGRTTPLCTLNIVTLSGNAQSLDRSIRSCCLRQKRHNCDGFKRMPKRVMIREHLYQEKKR